MFSIGDSVRVLPPFAEFFPDVYVVTDVVHGADGSTTYILGAAGGFDAVYLGAA